jgi:hypothetical protein
MAPWTLAAGAVAAALFLAAAGYFFTSAQPLRWKITAGFFATFGVLGLLDLLLSRIVLAPDELVLISLFRRRGYPRSAFVAAKVEAGAVCLQRHEGGWLQLPSTGHNALAVRNTVHAWIRGTATEAHGAAHGPPADAG